jgi:hypothetical protein
MFNPNLLKQLKAMPSDDRESMESNSQLDSALLRNGSGGDRALVAGASASVSSVSSSAPAARIHSGHLEHNNGSINASFNRNAMGMHPYMMDNSPANIANAYAMQAQALGGFHPRHQFPSGSQAGTSRDFQQQAAMYHMMNGGGGNIGSHPPQNPHHYFAGLAGAIPFSNATAMPNYDESGGVNQAQQTANSDDQEETEVVVPKRKKKESKKKRKKKPKDCPRRPLSGYNLFFKDERKRILAAIPESEKDKKPKDPRDEITWPGKKRAPHGKIGFENLAKTIGARWKEIEGEQLKHYKDLATKDLHRYAREMKEYEAKLSSGQIKEPSDDEDSSSEEEEVKPVKRKKVSKTKKRSGSLKKDDVQGSSNNGRSMTVDPYAFHQHQQQQQQQHQLHQNVAAGHNFNFGSSEQEQLYHLRKLQQSMFGGISFNDGNPNNFFGDNQESTNQRNSPPLNNTTGSPPDFDNNSKKDSE